MTDQGLTALASEAFFYGYPLVADVDEVIRFTRTGMGSVPAAPFNQFSHARTLAGPADTFVTINNDTWKKISPANQKAMTDLAAKLEPEFWASSLKADADSNKRLTDGGMQIVIPSPQMMADLRKKTEPMIAEFIKRVPAAEKPIKAYLVEMKRA